MNLIKILSGWIVALLFFGLWLNADSKLKQYSEIAKGYYELHMISQGNFANCQDYIQTQIEKGVLVRKEKP